MEKKSTAEEFALKKLQYGMRTENEIVDSLREEGYDRAEISQTMDYLRSMNYVDDIKYIKEYYKVSREKGWAENKIVFELGVKGIDKEEAKNTIREYKASPEYDGLKDDDAYALRIGVKMAFSQLEEGKSMNDNFFGKVGRRLMSLGYREHTVYYVLDKLRHGGRAAHSDIEGLDASIAEKLTMIERLQHKLELEIESEVELTEQKRKTMDYLIINGMKGND